MVDLCISYFCIDIAGLLTSIFPICIFVLMLFADFVFDVWIGYLFVSFHYDVICIW